MAITSLSVADASLRSVHSMVVPTLRRTFPFSFANTIYLQISSIRWAMSLYLCDTNRENEDSQQPEGRYCIGDNLLTNDKWSYSINFSDTFAFYRSRKFGQESLQPSESNCTTLSCPLGGRRSPILHVSHWFLSQTSFLPLLTFKTSEANYLLHARQWLVDKVSDIDFLTRNWKPVTLNTDSPLDSQGSSSEAGVKSTQPPKGVAGQTLTFHLRTTD